MDTVAGSGRISSVTAASPAARAARARFGCALVLACVSGAAALAHQVLWTRRLVDVLGASADTFAHVVGAFFLGLSGGAWLAARTRGWSDAWRGVALAEGSVAVLALPLVLAARWSDAGLAALAGWAGWKLVLPLLLVTPPAVAMGLVLPWMLRALAVQVAARPGRVPVLYAVNTLGGVGGLAAILLVAVRQLGLERAGWAAVGLNAAVAVGAWLLRDRVAQRPPATAAPASDAGWPGPVALLLAFASGWLVLALEVLFQHQFAQVTINSFLSGGAVLGLVLLALGVAALVAPRLASRVQDRMGARMLAGVSIFAGLGALIEPWTFAALQPGLRNIPYELAPPAYGVRVLVLGAATVLPVCLVAGLLFPLLLNDTGGSGRGTDRRVAWLLAANGVGGWLGAELAAAVFLPWLGLWRCAVLLAGGYLLLGVALGVRSPGKERRWIGVGAVACVVAVVALAARLAGALPQVGRQRGERVAACAVGREGVVAVIEGATNDWRMLFNNTYTLGGSLAGPNQERQAHLPLLLHGRAQSVALLGLATGSTLAGATLHPDLVEIEAAELSPLVFQFGRDHFGPWNRHALDDPRVTVRIEDARRVIARRRHAFDVVIGDLFLPWRTGEGRLFSREHFAAVRRALKPDGLFCQWLPMFQLTRPQFDAIVRTFRDVFPDALLVRGDFYTELPILGLVGGRRLETLDWPAIETACARLRDGGRVTDPLVRHADGVAMLLVGNLSDPGPGPVNTLGNAWPEWDAGRNVIGLREPWFIGVPQATFVRETQRSAANHLPPDRREAQDAGQFFLTLEIAAKVNSPALPNLRSQVEERLPRALREDPAADWRTWPSRVKPGPFGGGQHR